MFKRIILEDWQNLVPYFSVGFTFTIFLIAVIYAMLMKKDKADHMARLPLESDDKSNRKH